MRRLTKKLLLLSRQLKEDYAGRKANDETVCWWRRLSHSWHTFSPTAASGISKITSCDWPTQKYLVALIRFGPISLTACVYLAPSGQRNNGSTVFSLPSKKTKTLEVSQRVVHDKTGGRRLLDWMCEAAKRKLPSSGDDRPLLPPPAAPDHRHYPRQ